jgi:hypothetical protein
MLRFEEPPATKRSERSGNECASRRERSGAQGE